VRFDGGGFSSNTALYIRHHVYIQEMNVMMEGDVLSTISLTLSLFGPILDAVHAARVETSTDLDFVSDATDHIELGRCRGCLLAEYFEGCGRGFGNDAGELVHFVADFETLSISTCANNTSHGQALDSYQNRRCIEIRWGKYSIVSAKSDTQALAMAILYLRENLVVERDIDELAIFRIVRDIGRGRSKGDDVESLARQSQHGAIVLRIGLRRDVRDPSSRMAILQRWTVQRACVAGRDG